MSKSTWCRYSALLVIAGSILGCGGAESEPMTGEGADLEVPSIEIPDADAGSSDEGSSSTDTSSNAGTEDAVVAADADSDSTPGGGTVVKAKDQDASAADEAVADVAAEPEKLGIGDTAPTLAIGKWMKGEPLDDFEAGKVHVVEFWATWCGPCLRSMPHISQLQTEYADDVNFIGISDEDPETVAAFLSRPQAKESDQTWDDVLTYRIALDGPSEPMNQAYMRAAGQGGIPTAFIVGRDGVVQWIGHPMSMDAPLADIVSGQWDLEVAKKQFEAGRLLSDLRRSLRSSMRTAQQSGDWSPVIAQVDQAIDEGADPSVVKRMKFSVLMMAGQADNAQMLLEEIAQASWDDPNQLNEFAWMLATNVGDDVRDAELTLRLATRAAELTDFKRASILDTLARAYYVQGDLDTAIEWQQKAAEADDDGSREAVEKTLKEYLAEKAEQETPEET